MARERLLDELDPEADEVRDEARPGVGLPSRVRVDPQRAVVHTADGLERLEVVGTADLDLQGREAARASGPLRDDLRLVDPDREVRRRDLCREAEQAMDGQPDTLAEQVVERDVERALGGAVVGDHVVRRGRRTAEGRRCARAVGLEVVGIDSREEQRQHDRDRVDGLAVVRVGVALAVADEVRPVGVPELNDD